MLLEFEFNDMDSEGILGLQTLSNKSFKFQNGLVARVKGLQDICYTNPGESEKCLADIRQTKEILSNSLYFCSTLSALALYDLNADFCESKLIDAMEFVELREKNFGLHKFVLGYSNICNFSTKIWERKTAISNVKLEFQNPKIIFNNDIVIDLNISRNSLYFFNLIIFFIISMSDQKFDEFVLEVMKNKHSIKLQSEFTTNLKNLVLKNFISSIFANESIKEEVVNVYSTTRPNLTFTLNSFDAKIKIFVDCFSAKPYKIEFSYFPNLEEKRIMTIETVNKLLFMKFKNEEISIMGIDYLLNLCE